MASGRAKPKWGTKTERRAWWDSLTPEQKREYIKRKRKKDKEWQQEKAKRWTQSQLNRPTKFTPRSKKKLIEQNEILHERLKANREARSRS